MRKDEFDYRGILSGQDLHLTVGQVALPIAPKMSEQTQEIPAKYGNQYLGTSWSSKEIQIPIAVQAQGDQELYLQLMQNISNVLIETDDDPSIEYPLRFGWQPDVTYWGHFTSVPQPTFISTGVFDTAFTLVFTMSDPRGYLPKESMTIDPTKENVITPKGNAKTEPIFTITPKEPLYYCGYVLNEQIMAIGSDDPVTDAPEYTRVLSDPMNTMASFTTDASILAPIKSNKVFHAQGQAESNGSSIIVTPLKDGTGRRYFGDDTVGDWYGPVLAYKKGLTKTLTDWRVTTYMHHSKFRDNYHSRRAIASNELLLLDTNGQTIGRIAIQDILENMSQRPRLQVQLVRSGGSFSNEKDVHTIIDTVGANSFYINRSNITVKITYKKDVTVKKMVNGKTIYQRHKKGDTGYVKDYDNSGLFSDFNGKITLEKRGNEYNLYIDREYDPKSVVTKKNAYHLHEKWIDNSHVFDECYVSSFAIAFLKHAIEDDEAGYKYHEPYLSNSGVTIDEINTSDKTRKPIALAGQKIEINTASQQVTVDGKVCTQINWSSEYPLLYGGKPNPIMFSENLAGSEIIETDIPEIK